MGLPSYTGGCQYSFDQQVDRQNIVLKIDSDDYPMKSDLHGLKCAIINNNGHRDLLCSDPRPLPRPPRPGLGADRVQYGACVDNGTPTLPLRAHVHNLPPGYSGGPLQNDQASAITLCVGNMDQAPGKEAGEAAGH